MATYSIQAPNGKTYQVDGPDGASDDAVRAEVVRQHPDAGSAAPAAPEAPKPATFLSTMGRAAYNLPMDTAETLKGTMQQFGPDGVVAQTVAHPIKAVEGVGDWVNHAADVLRGGAQRVREMSSPDAQGDAPKMDTAAFDNFANKYGTKQGIYKAVGDHPAGTLLAAASILDPALRAGGVEDGIVGAADRGTMAATDAMKARLQPAPPRVIPPTTAALKSTASDLYAQAKKAGVVINGQSFANFSDEVKAAMENEGVDPTITPKSAAALKRIQDTGGDVSLNKMEILRRVAGNAAGAIDKSDRRIGRLIQDHIDDYVQGLEPHNIIAGDAPKAVGLLQQARDTWQNAARGQTIDDLITKARQNAGTFKSNLDGAYRQEFKKLANNARGIARFTPEQQDAIRKVAFGDGPVQGVMHVIGRIIPNSQTGVLTTSGVAAAAHLAGAPVAGPVGAAVTGAGLAGKIGSTMITSRNAQRASEMARAGSKITPRSDAYYQIQQRRAARTQGTP